MSDEIAQFEALEWAYYKSKEFEDIEEFRKVIFNRLLRFTAGTVDLRGELKKLR